MASSNKPRDRSRREAEESVSVHVRHRGNPGEKPIEVEIKDETTHSAVASIQDLPHVARVRIEGSVTKNLGNYESARISVAIEWPCRPNEKSLDKTYKFLSEKIDTKIQEELETLELAD